ncbi:uncharacterized protein UPF0489 [Ureibacillus chungkukjangi]|uniref:Uncharacterized protein UPF0489 n=2 Tax=Ureibacillus chungkukjangi TaxID=1202712 RepID=A0A318TLB5_9BACL|nr:uncharacterized protein UPF0489 [Ureibacillus chungkukjangi]
MHFLVILTQWGEKMRDGNKICFPDKNIYIMDNHKWAFYIWELAREKSIINPNATLIHVDAHLDDCPFVLQDNPEYLEIEELSSLKRFTENHITYDTFIWPAFGRGTIDNIIYVSDFSSEPFEDWATNYVKGRTYTGLRVRTMSKLQEIIENGLVESFVNDKSLILNLDLDFFNEENFHGRNPRLKPDEEVYNSLTYLKNVYNWDLITVAISPECCGGEEPAQHLLDIFIDVFEIDIAKLISWDIV